MYLVRNLVVVIVFGLMQAMPFFLLAGRWDVWNVWVAVGIFLAWNGFQRLVAYRENSDSLKEPAQSSRSGPALRVHRTAEVTLLLAIISQWAIAGLDHRFHWSDGLPSAVVVTGLVLLTICWGLATWATLVNPGGSREIRVDVALGQRVAREGPYAVIRHPSFALIPLAVFTTGLALDSLVAVIPAIVLAAVVVPLTTSTDQMRRNELSWYTAYAAKVRYRLVPGLW
jgi:protein-S-isoprenylcysteine O-methyltransferase Ste14